MKHYIYQKKRAVILIAFIISENKIVQVSVLFWRIVYSCSISHRSHSASFCYKDTVLRRPVEVAVFTNSKCEITRAAASGRLLPIRLNDFNVCFSLNLANPTNGMFLFKLISKCVRLDMRYYI